MRYERRVNLTYLLATLARCEREADVAVVQERHWCRRRRKDVHVKRQVLYWSSNTAMRDFVLFYGFASVPCGTPFSGFADSKKLSIDQSRAIVLLRHLGDDDIEHR